MGERHHSEPYLPLGIPFYLVREPEENYRSRLKAHLLDQVRDAIRTRQLRKPVETHTLPHCSRPICSSTVTISAPCRSCSATETSARR